jgi:hypothetical protein
MLGADAARDRRDDQAVQVVGGCHPSQAARKGIDVGHQLLAAVARGQPHGQAVGDALRGGAAVGRLVHHGPEVTQGPQIGFQQLDG